MTETTLDEAPLAGCTVAVTAARRREELTSLLERRGARVVEAPAIRIVPTTDDEQLLRLTQECLRLRPDVVVVTTAVGFRGWLTAADGWGLGASLRAWLAGAEVLARGPKVRGAVRAAGLRESWSPDSEASEEILTRLLEAGVRGRRIALQLHGEPQPEFTSALRAAGADVLELPVYRWLPAQDLGPLRQLVDQLVSGSVDCLTFTSAPAVTSLLQVAAEHGSLDAVVDALRERVLVAAVGPVTAAPLDRAGIPSVQPERARLAALVRTVVEELPAHRLRQAART